LDGDQLGHDLLFGGRELFGQGREGFLEVGVLGLSGQGLGPVEGEVEVAAAVVDAGADFAGGALVVFQELAVGLVEGLGEHGGFRVFLGDAEVFEAGGESKKLTE